MTEFAPSGSQFFPLRIEPSLNWLEIYLEKATPLEFGFKNSVLMKMSTQLKAKNFGNKLQSAQIW